MGEKIEIEIIEAPTEGGDDNDDQSKAKLRWKVGDEEFDIARAMSTIRTQRSSESTLKQEKDALAAQVKELSDKVAGFEDQGRTELERVQLALDTVTSERDSLKQQLEELGETARKSEVRSTVLLEAAKEGTTFRDPNDALVYLDPDDLEYDDKGLPKPASVTKVLKDLLESKPYLAAEHSTTENGNGSHQRQRVPATPKADDDKHVSDQEIQRAQRRSERTVRKWW